MQKILAIKREIELIERGTDRLTDADRGRLAQLRRNLRIMQQAPLPILPPQRPLRYVYPAETLEVALQRIRLHFGRQ